MTEQNIAHFNLQDADIDPVVVKSGSFFYLWCCDCSLRHIVFVDKGHDDTVKIGLSRDHVATKNARKLENIVVYQRNAKKDKKAT